MYLTDVNFLNCAALFLACKQSTNYQANLQNRDLRFYSEIFFHIPKINTLRNQSRANRLKPIFNQGNQENWCMKVEEEITFLNEIKNV